MLTVTLINKLINMLLVALKIVTPPPEQKWAFIFKITDSASAVVLITSNPDR